MQKPAECKDQQLVKLSIMPNEQISSYSLNVINQKRFLLIQIC